MENKTLHRSQMAVYNIKAVSRIVGLLPVTLRAWERRYGMPAPKRGDQGYRLYSEHDLRTLRWLKTQIDSGLSISRAVEHLNQLRTTGQDPAENLPIPRPEKSALINASLTPLMNLQKEFLNALLRFDETEANDTMHRAFSLHSIDQVLIQVVQPTLVEIGEAWHRGELPIAVEHYATQFCMQNLMSMLSASAPATKPGTLIAACAPGEMHQIGIIMIVVMLRWRGWDVKYLGPDLSLERLAEALRPITPRMLLFTATRPEAASSLDKLGELLKLFPKPQPLVVLGGQAFAKERLPENVPAIYINSNPTETVNSIEEMLNHY